MALGNLGLARLDSLAPGLAREVLRRDLAIAVHEHDERLAVLVLHDEGLHDLALRDVERNR